MSLTPFEVVNIRRAARCSLSGPFRSALMMMLGMFSWLGVIGWLRRCLVGGTRRVFVVLSSLR